MFIHKYIKQICNKMFKIWQNSNLSSKFITDMFTIKEKWIQHFSLLLRKQSKFTKTTY